MYWDTAIFKQIIKQSGPLVIQHAISIISWLFFFLLVGRMEKAEQNLAISNSMRNVFALFGVITWALASTTNTMVSNLYGQRKNNEVIPLLKKLLTIALAFSCSIGIILVCFPTFFVSTFSNDANLLEAAKPTIQVVVIAMIMMSVSVILLNTVIGSGHTQFTLITEITVLVLYLTYTYFAMEVFRVNIAMGWLNEFVYWVGLGLMSAWFIKKKLLKNKSAV
jgi:Na+-driven multidrug efflux pump